jgi:hypothetical protein
MILSQYHPGTGISSNLAFSDDFDSLDKALTRLLVMDCVGAYTPSPKFTEMASQFSQKGLFSFTFYRNYNEKYTKPVCFQVKWVFFCKIY